MLETSQGTRHNLRAGPLKKGFDMPIDPHLLALFAFSSFFAFCSLGAFCFWYQHRTWSERRDLIREMALAMGELRAFRIAYFCSWCAG